MEKKQRDDAVYVTGLPDDVTTDKLSELFGSIGVIKVSCVETVSCVPVNMLCAVLQNNRRTNSPMINLYNDKMTGKFKVRSSSRSMIGCCSSCPASVPVLVQCWVPVSRRHFSSQGEAMITYEDPQAAKAAIDWFNGEFCNKHLS